MWSKSMLLLISPFYSSGQQSPQYYAGTPFYCMSFHFLVLSHPSSSSEPGNNQIFRSWGSAGHLNGRIHDQPTAVPAAHPAPRSACPPSPSHAGTAAPATTGKFFHERMNFNLANQMQKNRIQNYV